MTALDVQETCEQGQSLLMETRYLEAERVLAGAEKIAWEVRDWDTLSRLYMPLQEARRQRRQRCGEGIVALDLVAEGASDEVDPAQVLANYPHGQLLVAGWGSIKPQFYLGIALAALGGCLVSLFGPTTSAPAKLPPAATQSRAAR